MLGLQGLMPLDGLELGMLAMCTSNRPLYAAPFFYRKHNAYYHVCRGHLCKQMTSIGVFVRIVSRRAGYYRIRRHNIFWNCISIKREL